MNIYMQDKRAKKKMPPFGTKKYPIYWLGEGKVIRNSIVIDPKYAVIPMLIKPKYWRFYAISKRKQEYLDGINSVQFAGVWFPKEIR